MNRNRQPCSTWNEQRVDRLLQELFGPTPASTPASLRRRWSPWVAVAVCALLLLALLPAFSVHHQPSTTADSDDHKEILAVAEVSVDEDSGDLESPVPESAGDEDSESEISREESESSST